MLKMRRMLDPIRSNSRFVRFNRFSAIHADKMPGESPVNISQG